jgi:dUTP pyrophosphatase
MSSTLKLKFKKLSEKAIIPKKGSIYAAGYDLHSSKEITIPKKGKNLVPTNLSCAIPNGCYGRIAPRSGLAAKNFIDVGAGVIDSDYRGESKFNALFNNFILIFL